MPLNTIPLPYGLRDVKITPYTDASATVLGSPVDLPYGRTLSFAAVEEFQDLRGDDKLIATHGSGEQVEWELESGGVSFEAVAAMYGGTVGTTGVTPNQIKTLEKSVTQQRPYFKIEGQVISDSGGDMHCVIYKAKATGNLEGEFTDGEFFLTSASGLGLPSTVVADLDKVWKFVQNETATAIV